MIQKEGIKAKFKINIFLLFIVGFCLSFIGASCTFNPLLNRVSPAPNFQRKVIRIGHQPHGVPPILKKLGSLEKRLLPMGFKVDWKEFPAGPPIMEALGKGEIDLGMAGEVPPLFAQAKGLPIFYVANEPPLPQLITILVPKDSPIQSLENLKGKKIAVAKASAGQYLLIQALNKIGLTLNNVEPVYLLPPEGMKAFENGEVDAWAIWDPFFALIEEKKPVRILTTGEGLSNNMNFYFVTQSFANNNDMIIKIVIDEMRKVGLWVPTHQQEAAQILASNSGLKLAVALKIIQRARYEAQPIQDQAIEEQQRIADTFFRLGLLPKSIRVEDAVWKRDLRN
jgi:sulfonate transport system substrate-binding protein